MRRRRGCARGTLRGGAVPRRVRGVPKSLLRGVCASESSGVGDARRSRRRDTHHGGPVRRAERQDRGAGGSQTRAGSLLRAAGRRGAVPVDALGARARAYFVDELGGGGSGAALSAERPVRGARRAAPGRERGGGGGGGARQEAQAQTQDQEARVHQEGADPVPVGSQVQGVRTGATRARAHRPQDVEGAHPRSHLPRTLRCNGYLQVHEAQGGELRGDPLPAAPRGSPCRPPRRPPRRPRAYVGACARARALPGQESAGAARAGLLCLQTVTTHTHTHHPRDLNLNYIIYLIY